LRDLLAISGTKTLDRHNAGFFRSAELRQLFNRFATYNGSSPFETPATFALIPHVEFGLGAWYVRGGMYQIPRALERLARESGIKIFTESAVENIIVENKIAVGVQANGETFRADYVIANSDAIETYRHLIEKKNAEFLQTKNSKSASLRAAVSFCFWERKEIPAARASQYFFSDDYRAEFDQIFKRKIPAANPTVYICATSVSDATQAPHGHENLFVLINAPYTNEQVDWEKEKRNYRDLIVKKLEDFGLDDLENSIDFEQTITPADFEKKYNANRGSIYGVSSNGIFSAFMRVPNKARDIENLYFAGGATHPGGGIPLVLLSGKMAAEMIVRGK
jgi:phytoene desaturase